MKIQNLVKNIALSTIAGALLIGCGSDSSDTLSGDTTVQTGTFVDAPVKGLKYITATQNGYTNEKGEFKYKAGETVEFKLGSLSLGKVEAGGLITPYTMAGVAVGTDSNKSTNIALLLQNLDANRTNTNVLDVSKLKDFNFSDFNLSESPSVVETKISSKLMAGDFDSFIDASNIQLLQIAEVKNTMKTFVEAEDRKRNDISKIIGKDYVVIRCSAPLGCVNKGNVKFTDTHIIGTYNNKDFSDTYEKLDSGIIKVTWSEPVEDDQINYFKFLDISNNVVSVCVKSTEKKAKSCTKEESWVIPSIKDSYIKNKMLESKASVTDFSELKDKKFTQAYLDGKTLYSVWDNQIWSFKFSNGMLSLGDYNLPYSVTDDGLLKVDENGLDGKTDNSSDRYQYYKILAIDGEKISTCEDDTSLETVKNCTTHSQWLFTTESSAQTYLDSL